MKKIQLKKLLCVLLLVLPVSIGMASAAMDVYMFVTVDGMLIEGSCPVSSLDRDGSMVVYRMEHSVAVPTDPASGAPTGKRQHNALKITKEIDKATPLLYKALVNNEHVDEVELRFYRPSIGGDGSIEHYYTIKLEDARIVDMGVYFPLTFLLENVGYRHMEDVSFVYQRITWTWMDGGIEMTDDIRVK